MVFFLYLWGTLLAVSTCILRVYLSYLGVDPWIPMRPLWYQWLSIAIIGISFGFLRVPRADPWIPSRSPGFQWLFFSIIGVFFGFHGMFGMFHEIPWCTKECLWDTNEILGVSRVMNL